LDREAVDRKELNMQKSKLAEQLKAMEEKLIKGKNATKYYVIVF
jgi:hypothetical protein